MKELLLQLEKAFENKLRLGIMSALVVNDYLDFNALKDLLGATDGNLASHLKALEKKEYIRVHKEFINRKPNTQYSATTGGKAAFEKHLNALSKLIQ
ncbi:transcriptional regulator [Persicobacter diffluens]|uniref:Transcriptional regulator n=1 Tax=Persicobacter diffluens TaxID=981 RepID=A0AAN4W069_9BACT|nr:transcriptional regulator [Persicobacter diffluens]